MINRFSYSVLMTIALPLLVARLLIKSVAQPAYRRRIAERFGSVAKVESDGIWLHVVSVGETIAAVPLVNALLNQYPDRVITITSTTPTGSERVKAAFGDSVNHCYAPFDVPFLVKRFMNAVQPKLALMMETELWPNYLHECDKRAVAVALINGRLSKKSARGYAGVAGLTRTMLGSIDLVASQTEAHARRFAVLGLLPERSRVTGNLKYDLQLPTDLADNASQYRKVFAESAPVWVAASTHEGEEAIALAAHERVVKDIPDAKLILVPRHPERFDRAEELIRDAGFSVARRSDSASAAGVQVLLGDTMGELLTAYKAADIAFVGGSLVPVGGHNAMEPAALCKAIISGPHTHNFADLFRQLEVAGAVTEVSNAQTLADAVVGLFSDRVASEKQGRRAARVVEQNRGALYRTLELIQGLMR